MGGPTVGTGVRVGVGLGVGDWIVGVGVRVGVGLGVGDWILGIEVRVEVGTGVGGWIVGMGVRVEVGTGRGGSGPLLGSRPQPETLTRTASKRNVTAWILWWYGLMALEDSMETHTPQSEYANSNIRREEGSSVWAK